MASYKQERDLAVSTLRRAAQMYNFCEGCAGENFAKCIYPEGPGEDVRCDNCRQCICGKCHKQSLWTWKGTPAPDVAPVVRCRDCALEGRSTCTLARIERAQLVFINHGKNWFCADGVKKEEVESET